MVPRRPASLLLDTKGYWLLAERQPCGGWLVNVLGADTPPMSWVDVEDAVLEWLKGQV